MHAKYKQKILEGFFYLVSGYGFRVYKHGLGARQPETRTS